MTNFKTEETKIQNAFNSIGTAVIDTDEWEMVRDMAYQQNLELKGMLHWPYEGCEECNINNRGCPEAIQVENNVVTFYYF